jgi:hypothetical protein
MSSGLRWPFESPGADPDSCAVSSFLFLRSLGGISLLAFLSLWVQIHGLVGSRGILPVADLLEFLRERAGAERYWELPTLLWLGSGDGALNVLCAGGVLASFLLLLGFVPAPALLAIWTIYLSLATGCREFLSFQWDNLLLETSFVALLMAPLTLRHRLATAVPPVRLAHGLVLWLLFRLTFSSGVVKLASGDPTWRHLDALKVHYETQPLPTWIGWWAHQLPGWFQTLSAAVMFGIELGVPFLILAPRRLRRIACGLLVALQIVIALTGNYAFFNLLAIALCLPLLDDGFFPARLRPVSNAPRARHVPVWILGPAAVVILVVSTIELLGAFRFVGRWPAPVRLLYEVLSPFRTVNGYGLFAVMTTTRPEIVIEGSDDGTSWRSYEFRWKPGDLTRRPSFVAPHQPRLDWQMWFAALGSVRQNPWFVRLMQRLLEGSPEVLGLLGKNPFPGKPPRYVRAVLYQYGFTDPTTLPRTGAWWHREAAGLYCPEVSLRDRGGRDDS